MSESKSLPISQMNFDGFGRITGVQIVSARPLTEADCDAIVNYVRRRNLAIRVTDDPNGLITMADRDAAIQAATKE